MREMNRALAVASVALLAPLTACDDDGDIGLEPTSYLISESAILAGLAPGAVFPFIDTTPRDIVSAHIAITDASTNCSAGAAAPTSIQVLVGQAGVALVPVMTAATNTGISTTPGQCVFHVTVTAGAGGVPDPMTDIVVNNGGTSPLTGIHTITASAEVR